MCWWLYKPFSEVLYFLFVVSYLYSWVLNLQAVRGVLTCWRYAGDQQPSYLWCWWTCIGLEESSHPLNTGAGIALQLHGGCASPWPHSVLDLKPKIITYCSPKHIRNFQVLFCFVTGISPQLTARGFPILPCSIDLHTLQVNTPALAEHAVTLYRRELPRLWAHGRRAGIATQESLLPQKLAWC